MAIKKRDESFLRGLQGGRHWKETEARRALKLLAESGISRAAFARQYGLRASRLAWWKRRIETTSRPVPGQGQVRQDFVELVPSPTEVEPVAVVRVGAVQVEVRRLDEGAAKFVARLAGLAEEGACS